MEHIRTTSFGENRYYVTVSDGKDTYRMSFIDGQRGNANKFTPQTQYLRVPGKGYRFVKGPERFWKFAEECLQSTISNSTTE